MIDTRFVPLFDKWSERYDTHVHKQRTGFFQNYESIVQESVRESMRVCPPPAKVLDIGIGTGNVAGPLVQKGYQVFGIDVSPKMLAKCAEKYPSITLAKGDFLDLPFPDVQFDIIMSGYALHHIPDDAKVRALESFKRRLASGGAVLITDIMFYDLAARDAARKALGEAYDDDEHYPIVTWLVAAFADMEYSVDFKRMTEYVWMVSAKVNA